MKTMKRITSKPAATAAAEAEAQPAGQDLAKLQSMRANIKAIRDLVASFPTQSDLVPQAALDELAAAADQVRAAKSAVLDAKRAVGDASHECQKLAVDEAKDEILRVAYRTQRDREEDYHVAIMRYRAAETKQEGAARSATQAAFQQHERRRLFCLAVVTETDRPSVADGPRPEPTLGYLVAWLYNELEPLCRFHRTEFLDQTWRDPVSQAISAAKESPLKLDDGTPKSELRVAGA